MEFREFRAKTVNDAITDALIELEITSDMIEYEVIEEGSAGILGLFSKNAVIRARRREDAGEEELFDIKKEIRAATLLKEEKPKAEKKASKPAQKESSKETEADKAVKQNLKAAKKAAPQEGAPAAKTPNKAKDPQAVRENAAKESVVKENAAKNAAVKAEAKPEKAAAPVKDVDEQPLRSVLNAIFDKLDVKADISIDVNKEERTVNINVDGEDTGDLIGKKGQTLDAIQYILSIMVNKEQESYFRVKLDTNNYRERRQKTLENLAKNMAAKVKKTHRKVTLEPMNPYERRVIHAYLQADKLVTTKSEGEEPNRRVVIYYKK